MKVELNLFASLAGYLPDKAKGTSCTVEIVEGATIRQLLEPLKMPAKAVKMIFLNGVHANGDETLKDGDRVGVFPPVAGG
jgi:molybdopterin converting factor small subunit